MILEIYTDGSCMNNPTGPSGWGFLLLSSEKPGAPVYEKCGATHNEKNEVVPSSNQRAELMALAKALELLVRRYQAGKPDPAEIVILSDSAYMLNTLINKWYITWKRYTDKDGNWLNSKHIPITDQWLWESIIINTEFFQSRGVKFIYTKVKAHSGDKYNERVDKLAKAGTQLAKEILLPCSS